jgi:hypothetical protein
MSNRNNRHKAAISLPPERSYQLNPLEIVADGAIANVSAALGSLIPVLLVNANQRPDVREVVAAHMSHTSGDVTAVWLRRLGKTTASNYMISLALIFVRPIESLAMIDFNTAQAGVVDQILRIGYLYLQPSKPGDRLATTLESGRRVLIEVKDTEFEADWEEMLRKHLVAEFRARGLSKSMSREAADTTITSWRKFGEFRMPYRPGGQRAHGEDRSDSD